MPDKTIVKDGQIQNRPELVLAFLQECENNSWDLDSDDISHVLSLDFDYIRKQNELISDKEAQEILKDV